MIASVAFSHERPPHPFDAAHADDGERMRSGVELAQHVLARSCDGVVRRLAVELRFGALLGLVHHQPVEPDIEIRPALDRRDVAGDIVAHDDVIVAELRERARRAALR